MAASSEARTSVSWRMTRLTSSNFPPFWKTPLRKRSGAKRKAIFSLGIQNQRAIDGRRKRLDSLAPYSSPWTDHRPLEAEHRLSRALLATRLSTKLVAKSSASSIPCSPPSLVATHPSRMTDSSIANDNSHVLLYAPRASILHSLQKSS